MVSGVPKRASLLLTAALLTLPLLGACGKRAPEDLTSKLLYTASGSYDAQADVRDRVNRSTRTVLWVEHPPLEAARVEVTYASEARQVAWTMTITAPTFTVGDVLKENPGAAQPAGPAPGQRFTGGRLKNVLVLPTEDGLRLLTRGYAVQRETALLPLFDQPAP